MRTPVRDQSLVVLRAAHALSVAAVDATPTRIRATLAAWGVELSAATVARRLAELAASSQLESVGGCWWPARSWSLLLGDCRRLELPSEVDHWIADPPYSARTHDGHDSVVCDDRNELGYSSIDDGDVAELVAAHAPRVRGWCAIQTDTELAEAWKDHLASAGLLVFTEIPILAPGSRIRRLGDGPPNWMHLLIPARTRGRHHVRSWRGLPGYYIVKRPGRSGVVGAKSRDLCDKLIQHYSQPGDLILDTHAGSGMLGESAVRLGRRYIGCEIRPDAHAIALDRLSRTPELCPICGTTSGGSSTELDPATS